MATLVTAWMLCLCGCTAQQAAHRAWVSRQAIENLVHFDVASCQKPSGLVSKVTNSETILGGMLWAQPAILECLVPPKNRRGPEDSFVQLATFVDDTGVLHEVNGENLSPEGVACIQSALAPLQFQLLPPGKEKQTARMAIHYPRHSPQVTFGLNEVSDVMGHIRLALAKACHCYAPLESVGIAEVSLELTVYEGQPAHIFLSGNNPDMVECLTLAIEKLELQALQGGRVLERAPLQFIHSRQEVFPDEARLELLLVHADGLLAQNASVLAVRLGERREALSSYQKLSSPYKARPALAFAPAFDTLCARLNEANAAWVLALETQLQLHKRIADMAAKLRSQNALWEDAATQASEVALKAHAAVAQAQQALAADKEACQKKMSFVPRPFKNHSVWAPHP